MAAVQRHHLSPGPLPPPAGVNDIAASGPGQPRGCKAPHCTPKTQQLTSHVIAPFTLALALALTTAAASLWTVALATRSLAAAAILVTGLAATLAATAGHGRSTARQPVVIWWEPELLLLLLLPLLLLLLLPLPLLTSLCLLPYLLPPGSCRFLPLLPTAVRWREAVQPGSICRPARRAGSTSCCSTRCWLGRQARADEPLRLLCPFFQLQPVPQPGMCRHCRRGTRGCPRALSFSQCRSCRSPALLGPHPCFVLRLPAIASSPSPSALGAVLAASAAIAAAAPPPLLLALAGGTAVGGLGTLLGGKQVYVLQSAAGADDCD